VGLLAVRAPELTVCEKPLAPTGAPPNRDKEAVTLPPATPADARMGSTLIVNAAVAAIPTGPEGAASAASEDSFGSD